MKKKIDKNKYKLFLFKTSWMDNELLDITVCEVIIKDILVSLLTDDIYVRYDINKFDDHIRIDKINTILSSNITNSYTQMIWSESESNAIKIINDYLNNHKLEKIKEYNDEILKLKEKLK